MANARSGSPSCQPGVRSLRERVTGAVASLLPIPGVRSLRERVTGIEPALSAWEADVLPLNYTRVGGCPPRTSSMPPLPIHQAGAWRGHDATLATRAVLGLPRDRWQA